MKKERNPLTVILSIFFLSLFVILPPTFRNLIPKEEIMPSSESVGSLVIINCNKTYQDELYKVVSKSKYVNGKLNTNTLTYTKLGQANSNSTTVTDQTQSTNNGTIQEEQENSDKTVTNNTVENNVNNQTETVQQEEVVTNSSEILKEIDYFKTIPNLKLTEVGDTITIVIDNEVINSNPHEELLNKYFNNNYSKQMSFYKEKGFTCNKNEG